jgi:hypothetical protein
MRGVQISLFMKYAHNRGTKTFRLEYKFNQEQKCHEFIIQLHYPKMPDIRLSFNIDYGKVFAQYRIGLHLK